MSKRLTDEEFRLLYECTKRAAPVSRALRIRGVEELRTARAQLAKMGPALVEAHDALSSLRQGRWEIGYVKERVDRITAACREALSTPPDAKDDGNGE